MFSSSIASLSLFVSVVYAQNLSTWSPPGPGDVRSPCPGLNSLANHGILPHNGKGLTIPILIDALKKGLNIGADFSIAIGGHDASLSRADYNLDHGNNYSFNQSIFDTVLAYYDGMNATSIPVAAKAKYNRVTTEEKRESKFIYTPQQFILFYGETALYISVLGDSTTGVASIDYVKVSSSKKDFPMLNGGDQQRLKPVNMIFALNKANGEVLPEGLEITTNTVKLAFGGYDPITGVLADTL